MQERKDIITKTYQISDSGNWLIEIVEDVDNYNSYIYNENYGIKMFMFSVEKNTTSYDEYLELVYNNIEEYYNEYNEEYKF